MELRPATPGYFRAMGIGVTRGRGIEPGDTSRSAPVVVLSESAVRKYFPNENPIGQSIALGWRRPEGLPKAGGEVVGVVASSACLRRPRSLSPPSGSSA